MKKYSLTSKVWLYPGMSGWHFLSVPKKESAEIKSLHKAPRRGFGAIPVTVTINTTSWETSIFPDKHSGCFLLPLKSVVRKKESLFDGDTVEYTLALR
jgi:hypothetical protein